MMNDDEDLMSRAMMINQDGIGNDNGIENAKYDNNGNDDDDDGDDNDDNDGDIAPHCCLVQLL